jgi:hypothetical protein
MRSFYAVAFDKKSKIFNAVASDKTVNFNAVASDKSFSDEVWEMVLMKILIVKTMENYFSNEKVKP